jgi:carboxylesterase type B
VGNYRVGPLGFLAGSTVEKEGTPNAGIWDQIAVFEWVQKYANLFGGDKSDVSAWGESAGAGSIFHHFVLEGGKKDPLFRKALVQSPAVSIMWDRKGLIEDRYKEMEQLTGCTGKGLACLRNVPVQNITAAGNTINNEAAVGTFGFGPAADGTLLRQVPALEFASGNFWKGIESVISSHVKDEAEIFFDQSVLTDAEFDNWIQRVYPKAVLDAGWAAEIDRQYPSPNATGSRFKTEQDRMKTFLQDTVFTCNARYLSTAYWGRSWNIQYSAMGGLHGTDVAPTYYTGVPPIPQFAAYQSYVTSYATTGDPNTNRIQNTTIEWPRVNIGLEKPYPVLNVTDTGFALIYDSIIKKSTCDWFLNFQKDATALQGYTIV